MLKNKEIKKAASDSILKGGRLLTLVIGCCLFLWMCFMPIGLFAMPAEMIVTYCAGWKFSKLLDIILNVLFVIYYPLVSIPLFGGLIKMAYRMCTEKGKIYINDIFSPFSSSKTYFRVLIGELIIISELAALAAPVAVGVLSFRALDYIYALELPNIVIVLLEILIGYGVFITASVAFFAILLFVGYFYLIPYFLCKGEPILTSVAKSIQVMKGHLFNKLLYSIGYIPLILLSVATFGMLFVVYTAPLCIIAYFIYAEDKTSIYERNKEVENNGESE